MTPTESSSRYLLDIDELDRAIVNLSARINAANYELLVLVRRFDERAGWLKWGFLSCSDWLHWRCDLSLGAARDKVRVAHALKALPAISQAFCLGELSYSKVRALVRVADRGNEDELLSFARKTTAARVEERCRELRSSNSDSTIEANRSHARRSLHVSLDPARGTMTITVELPIEAGELVDRAIDRARDANASNSPEFADESWSAQRADALLTMASSYLAGHREERTGCSENYLVTVHVDQTALTERRGRSGLPIETARRIACDADRVIIVEGEDGEPLSVGRKTRAVPAAIKRALWSRDKGCAFPGCRNRRFVDAHHVRHWSAGGETSLDNLMLLCPRHHRLVHEGGFRIEKDYRDRWYFKRPDGLAVPSCGYHAEDMQDDCVRDSAESYLCALEISQLTRLPPPNSFSESLAWKQIWRPIANDSHSGNDSAESLLTRLQKPRLRCSPTFTAAKKTVEYTV